MYRAAVERDAPSCLPEQAAEKTAHICRGRRPRQPLKDWFTWAGWAERKDRFLSNFKSVYTLHKCRQRLKVRPAQIHSCILIIVLGTASASTWSVPLCNKLFCHRPQNIEQLSRGYQVGSLSWRHTACASE